MTPSCHITTRPDGGNMVLPFLHSLYHTFFVIVISLVFLGLVSGCAKEVPVEKPLNVIDNVLHPHIVAQDELKPGLSVLYFHQLYRHVSQMPKDEKIALKGKEGPPVLYLDHVFAKDVNIFDSGDSRGVGMFMSGYFHLPVAGSYIFQAKTNDGFEMFINDILILSDPGVHGDRLSDKSMVTVSEGGWFPVSIKYFQRKGTAALSLYWQPEGDRELSVVPKVVYAHVPR